MLRRRFLAVLAGLGLVRLPFEEFRGSSRLYERGMCAHGRDRRGDCLVCQRMEETVRNLGEYIERVYTQQRRVRWR